MRIALTADPELPVPPRLYGGIERIIDLLAQELVARGHEVSLFAHPDSCSAGVLNAWPGKSSTSTLDSVRNMALLARQAAGGHFDLIHSFSRVAYLLPLLPLRVPKLMTYQREVSPRSVKLATQLSRGSLWFSAISRSMMRGVDTIGTWRMIPNGVSLDRYDFVREVAPDAPLVFLGRIEEIKGPHLAIEIARRSGRRLVIAGNVPAAHEGWAQEHVLRHVDGVQVTYVGPVDDAAKNLLLGRAAAFLMPILWEEPFGIVMAEALACGTPVLALARGAAPEVVEHGVSGFVEQTVDGLLSAVARITQLDRARCRQRVEQHYSAQAITDGYERVYVEMIHAAGTAHSHPTAA